MRARKTIGRRVAWLSIAAGLALLCAPLAGSSPGHVPSASQASLSGGSLTVTFGDPSWDYVKFTITGADLKLKAGTAGSYEGTSTTGTFSLVGQMSVTRPPGLLSYTTMSAHLGSRSWGWPPSGEDNRVEGRTVSRSFNLKYTARPSDTYVTASVRLTNCGGICASASYDFMITLKPSTKPPGSKPPPGANPPPPLDPKRPTVRAYPVGQVLKPGSYGWLPWSARDASGKAKVHGTLYEGGARVLEGGTRYFLAADGQTRRWKAKLAADLRGPLYFCVWAENPSGKRSAKAPNSSCAWLSLLVDINRVSNTCGGEGWDVFKWVQNSFGNTSTFTDPDTGRQYVVDFSEACNLHDAGYGGHTVKDVINGGVVDFHAWDRERVDRKFQKDMQELCRKQIPPSAKRALLRCIGGATRYQLVRKVGHNFFDADLRKPGLQKQGPRDNS